MRPSPHSAFIIALLLCSFAAQAQPASIGDIINIYTPVTEIGGCGRIVVEDGTGFGPGDLVLIMQMQGAVIYGENSPAYGTITNYNNAGNFEFARIAAIDEDTIYLRHLLVRDYTIAGKVQLIRVPEYADVNVDAPLTGLPWDGKVGGVLVLRASGTVTLNADVDLHSIGFRGGKVVRGGQVGYYEGAYVGEADPDRFGLKGEGIGGYGIGRKIAGRGAPANGGGGGGNHNAGGGGGGNIGCGGTGGWAFQDGRYQGNYQEAQGLGGIPLNRGPGRSFLGGGGGAGHDNNRVGASGGDGGGIVIIDAGEIAGNGHRIVAMGDSALPAEWDGGGGGGGGGSIILRAGTFTGSLFLDARGGRGGNAAWAAQNSGPGGGGGGGLVAFAGGGLPAGVSIESIAGGDRGNHIYDGTAYGSSAGCEGDTLFNFPLPEGSVPAVGTGADGGPDTTICYGGSVILTPSAGVAYQWLPAIGLDCDYCPRPTASPKATTTYYVEIRDSSGCRSSDSVTVYVVTATTDAGPDRTICPGDSAMLTPAAGTSYRWSPPEGLGCTDCRTPMASPAATTTYRVEIRDANECLAVDTVTVHVIDEELKIALDPAGYIRLDSARMWDTVCTRIPITNNGGDTVVLSAADLADGIHFSIDPTQFPLIIPPQRSRMVEICYMPTDTLSHLDTLSLFSTCFRRVLLFSHGLLPLLDGFGDNCDARIRIVSSNDTLSGAVKVVPPYPNPSSQGRVTLDFRLAFDGHAMLEIYDISGTLVALPVDTRLAAGTYSVIWNAAGQPSGTYYYRLVCRGEGDSGVIVVER